MGLADRVVSIFDRARKFVLPPGIPEPPPIDKTGTGYALFMDESETTILYAKALQGPGVPSDDRTNSTMWLIEGQYYGPSRKDAFGNWIFRRCAR